VFVGGFGFDFCLISFKIKPTTHSGSAFGNQSNNYGASGISPKCEPKIFGANQMQQIDIKNNNQEINIKNKIRVIFM